MAWWGLRFLNVAPDAKVLDCGCGGGANIKRLLKKCPQGIVKGIDYSPVSVEKPKRSMRRPPSLMVAAPFCKAAWQSMMFADNWFRWSRPLKPYISGRNLPRCFREVWRARSLGGTFFICNESNGDTDKDEKWTKIINGMTIYQGIELKAYLNRRVFHEVQIQKKSWLCITARK
ncbi:MAG: class I SAM-dependent methyltransferase [Christensenellales bacterium]